MRCAEALKAVVALVLVGIVLVWVVNPVKVPNDHIYIGAGDCIPCRYQGETEASCTNCTDPVLYCIWNEVANPYWCHDLDICDSLGCWYPGTGGKCP